MANIEQEEWIRSDNLSSDMIRVLENGDFYDCTFETTCSLTGDKKMFQCHKLLLSISSCVFAKMLFGHFKEARQGADKAILLRGVTSEVFECCIRFIYGGEKNFQSTEMAMEVYKFAHEMQINSLMHAINNFLKTMPALEALAICDFCIQFDNKQGLKTCKELLQGKDSPSVLNSDAWLVASESVVELVLQLDDLCMSEVQVLTALLKWGRAQVVADDLDPTEGTLLRQKVESCLKYVRFALLTNKQFTELCKAELGWVLSGDEKFQILNCITQQKWNTMPAVLQPNSLTPRSEPQGQRVNVLLSSLSAVDSTIVKRGEKLSSSFSLTLSKKCYFVGLQYELENHSSPIIMAKMQPKTIKVTESNFPIYMLGQSYSDCKEGQLVLQKDCIFLAGVKYTVQLNFPSIPQETTVYKIYNFSSNSSSGSKSFGSKDKLIAKVEGPFVGVQVSKLVFRMMD